jgi:hypothetical protein
MTRRKKSVSLTRDGKKRKRNRRVGMMCYRRVRLENGGETPGAGRERAIYAANREAFWALGIWEVVYGRQLRRRHGN